MRQALLEALGSRSAGTEECIKEPICGTKMQRACLLDLVVRYECMVTLLQLPH